jgi:hypothetical protein
MTMGDEITEAYSRANELWQKEQTGASLEAGMRRLFAAGEDGGEIRSWAMNAATQYGCINYLRQELGWRHARASQAASQEVSHAVA